MYLQEKIKGLLIFSRSCHELERKQREFIEKSSSKAAKFAPTPPPLKRKEIIY